MTRLYQYIKCEKCGDYYSVYIGEYFGVSPSTKEPIVHGLCWQCEMKEVLSKRKANDDSSMR